jgi:hypothetical protein
MTPGLWLAARRHRLTFMNWSLDSNDWRCRNWADAKQCAESVSRRMRPGDIVLFHDNHEWIGSILEAVLSTNHFSNSLNCSVTSLES